MSATYAARPASSTPYALMAFFAVIIMALFAATALVKIKATEAAQAEASDTYMPVDEDVPVTDAVVDKTQI